MRTKSCHICHLEKNLMFRVKLDISKNWYFLCKECTKYNKANNINYVYGGTWKG